ELLQKCAGSRQQALLSWTDLENIAICNFFSSCLGHFNFNGDCGWSRKSRNNRNGCGPVAFSFEWIRGKNNALTALIDVIRLPIDGHSSHPKPAECLQDPAMLLSPGYWQRRQYDLFGRSVGMLSCRLTQRLAGANFQQDVLRIFQELRDAVGETHSVANVA